MIGWCWLAAAALAAGSDERPLDVVELVGGEQVAGIVLFEGPESVVVRVRSQERVLPAEQVERVDSLSRNLAMVLDQQRRTDWDRTDEVMTLARFCRAKGMLGLGRVFALRALANDPQNAGAHEFLGHLPSGEGWRVRDGARSIRYDKLALVRSDWGDAWILETPHYRLRTNLDLPQAVDLVCDLEHFYRSFYALLGSHMQLFEVTERMPAEVHADSVSFPEVLGGRRAYFRPGDFTLIVNAQGGLEMRTIFHEATHQLLYMTAVRERQGRGRVPGWLDEGLAETLAAGAVGLPGRMSVDGGARDDAYFAIHRASGDPYPLSRILTMDTSDFHGSTNLELKYAQCYTFVHFCLHAEKERYRGGFFRFIKSAYDGRASGSQFERAMDVPRDELERAWGEYVQVAGR